MTVACNEPTEINFVRLKRRVTELERDVKILKQQVSHLDIVRTGY